MIQSNIAVDAVYYNYVEVFDPTLQETVKVYLPSVISRRPVVGDTIIYEIDDVEDDEGSFVNYYNSSPIPSTTICNVNTGSVRSVQSNYLLVGVQSGGIYLVYKVYTPNLLNRTPVFGDRVEFITLPDHPNSPTDTTEPTSIFFRFANDDTETYKTHTHQLLDNTIIDGMEIPENMKETLREKSTGDVI